ncbi:MULTISPECIES: MarR family transcriptional regulator [unclassified Mesorhizobium]|uniref:MarR family winged helix-turn-helix transcriptional regulator n=1 Tax=unclassified Mesorhizobium TaxID=325217 RepID=UPI000BB02330|nr:MULTISPECIES: MarR family transcriptional regulator [unclassified Mesorhizobium]PBB24592.1 MarR family transcriptional regulator [Mesorhizobium sp. WSM4304]PBB73891.1 MarR family transcriptional regulator [Mesorhizobium sp. WSM4308]
MDENQPHTVPEMMSDDALDAQIGYNLKRASAFALNDFTVELTEAGLRPVTYGMLALIDERPGIRAAELCRLLGMKSANMAPLLAELEERGLVERDDHAEDRRVRILTLTPAARQAMPGWRRQVRRHEDRFLQRLTKKERATLLRLLRLIWTDEG